MLKRAKSTGNGGTGLAVDNRRHRIGSLHRSIGLAGLMEASDWMNLSSFLPSGTGTSGLVDFFGLLLIGWNQDGPIPSFKAEKARDTEAPDWLVGWKLGIGGYVDRG